jgi:hypothetical protein
LRSAVALPAITRSGAVLGAAGLLSLAGGASAATAPVADLPPQRTALNHEIILGEEELSDVSLSTFYVFDKEGAKREVGQQIVRDGSVACADRQVLGFLKNSLAVC